MENCDGLDCKILLELDKNARQSISEIARKLHVGRDTVDYRIERLKGNGVIKRFYSLINPYRLGQIVFRVCFNMKNDRQLMEELDALFDSDPSVFWLARCSGRWDRVVSVFAPSPRAFYAELSKVLSRYSAVILEYQVDTVVDVWLAYRHWLRPSGDKAFFFYGGELAHFPVDSVDEGILKHLIHDARAPVSEIAEEIQTTPAVVSYRIERLIKERVITGFRAELDLGRMQMLHFKGLVFLNTYTLAEEEKMRDFCILHPNIIYYSHQIGAWPIEIEVETESYEHFLRVIEELCRRFSNIVRHIETLSVGDSKISPFMGLGVPKKGEPVAAS